MEEKFTEEMSEVTNETVEKSAAAPKEKKGGVGAWILAFVPLIVAIVSNFALSIVFSIIASIQISAEYVANGMLDSIDPVTVTQETIARVTEMAPTMQVILEVVFLVIFALWYKKLIRKNPGPGFKRVLTPMNILLIVVASIAVEFAAQFEVSLYAPLFPNSLANLQTSMQSIGATEMTFLSVLTVAVMAPIAEELIFRGVTMKLLQKAGAGMWLAIILQGVFFGIFHMNLIQGIYAAEMGVALGYVAYRCKSIIPSCLMHIVINFSAIVISALNPSIDFNVIVCALLFVVLTAVLVVALKNVKLKEEVVSE